MGTWGGGLMWAPGCAETKQRDAQELEDGRRLGVNDCAALN